MQRASRACRKALSLSCDLRKLLIGVKRRWRRQRPFERCSAYAPRICAGGTAPTESLHHRGQEDDTADSPDERTDRGNEIPTRESIGVIRVAAWHALQTQEVHREKCEVHADERDPEVQLAEEFVVGVAGDLRKPEIPAREDREYGTQRQHVVE